MTEKKTFWEYIEDAYNYLPKLKGKVPVVVTNTETGITGVYYFSTWAGEEE